MQLNIIVHDQYVINKILHYKLLATELKNIIRQCLFHISEITLTDKKGAISTQKHSVDYNNRCNRPQQI